MPLYEKYDTGTTITMHMNEWELTQYEKQIIHFILTPLNQSIVEANHIPFA